MPPIEVWLLFEIGMIVVLAGCSIPFPGTAAEDTTPVVGRSGIECRVAPDIPVPLRIMPRCPRLEEPGVLIGGMIGDVVEDDFQVATMRLGEEEVEVG
jgi:hypothetical protein